jgi:AcrR family transcriptional regulator
MCGLLNDGESFIVTSMEKQRARSDGDKAQRYAEIVVAAREVLDSVELDHFAMAAVAEKLGLVKGTLYRYFPTREGLLLAVLQHECTDWFDHVDTRLCELESPLATVRSPQRASAVAALIVESLIARPRLLRMLSSAQTVLERNVPYETALLFKTFLLERSAITGRLLARALGLPRARGVRLLVHLNAVVVGLYGAAHPAPIVATVLAQPEFAPLRVDLRQELDRLVPALIAGLSPRSNP